MHLTIYSRFNTKMMVSSTADLKEDAHQV